MFAEALQITRNNVRDALATKREAAKKPAMKALLERYKGASALANSVVKLKQKLEAAERSLKALGFEIQYDGSIDLAYSAPKALKEALNQLLEEQLSEERQKVVALDEALCNVWSITSVTEARKLVESFA
jgi:hypothetical protein